MKTEKKKAVVMSTLARKRWKLLRNMFVAFRKKKNKVSLKHTLLSIDDNKLDG